MFVNDDLVPTTGFLVNRDHYHELYHVQDFQITLS